VITVVLEDALLLNDSIMEFASYIIHIVVISPPVEDVYQVSQMEKLRDLILRWLNKYDTQETLQFN